METLADWIKALDLIPHVEGGYYRQVYKSDLAFNADRALYTSIYFLLTSDNPSRFHRLTADEIWYFHGGQPLTIHMILPDGRYETVSLGSDLSQDCHLQYCVPRGTIFGSTVEQDCGFSVVSCMVAPGFEFDDFELFKQEELLANYPQHAEIIKRLTKC